MTNEMNDDRSAEEAIDAFEREIGVTGVPNCRVLVGNREFLKFAVGREAPLYTYALYESQKRLPDSNPFKGAMALAPEKASSFPASTEASALLTLLTRSTREVSQGEPIGGYSVPYVPFQKREDHQLAQPASHIVRGRRGVGKSTLIRRAAELLSETPSIVAILDMQTYSTLSGDDLIREVLYDMCTSMASAAQDVGFRTHVAIDAQPLMSIAENISSGATSVDRAPVAIKRVLAQLTKAAKGNAFLFLDDFHLIDHECQPRLLHTLNASLKGANGWLKVAGLSSLLNVYSPSDRKGLQVPGDAQYVSLDLTLENPEAAQAHLRAILEGFLNAVGYGLGSSVIPEAAFRRLAWANAGVPRDFLQMFGRSLEHASRNRHVTVTLSDVNIAIGEFGQQKMDDLQRDARNEAGVLRNALSRLESLCLDDSKINAFLVRSDDSNERVIVQVLSDLRMVHLIHQSITPGKAGERFEAFILDYSIFTGFRRRPNVKEMIPKELQFKASELRALPKVPDGFFAADLEG
ncbi:ATP-binding protein [Burkholderia seminalis]|uniref:ATP-binding protein n=1 Tax=Burkholderia seminalis TaxID=488731 RepID=UPI001906910F|nr:ATP-binding protein [Burkholderia seminalis]MBJ9967277.1 ATP-binding protein [Burkholderia seminalis]